MQVTDRISKMRFTFACTKLCLSIHLVNNERELSHFIKSAQIRFTPFAVAPLSVRLKTQRSTVLLPKLSVLSHSLHSLTHTIPPFPFHLVPIALHIFNHFHCKHCIHYIQCMLRVCINPRSQRELFSLY